MTRPAEQITVEFEDEEGVWAPASSDMFDGRDDVWTPWSVGRWYAEETRPERGIARALGMQTGPMGISSALHNAMRYRVRRGLLYPAWAALSIVEAETLKELELPAGTRLEIEKHACYLHFDGPEPIHVEEDLGLIRCDRSHDGLHWYVDGPASWSRKPDRFLAASDGADGHL